jgi:hypothetical protein
MLGAELLFSQQRYNHVDWHNIKDSKVAPPCAAAAASPLAALLPPLLPQPRCSSPVEVWPQGCSQAAPLEHQGQTETQWLRVQVQGTHQHVSAAHRHLSSGDDRCHVMCC